MKFGLALGRAHHSTWADLARCADDCGYESVWIPEHLVMPAVVEQSPTPGRAGPAPETPVYDAPAYLSFLAGITRTVRLGAQVYLAALRHPFSVARAFATLDLVSGGRAVCGVGAGWLEAEFAAAGIDFGSRGRRLDETIALCHRLWSEPTVGHDGEFFSFPPVCFEPKPVRPGGVPVFVGGESRAALRRAATLGDGWLGMTHTLDDVIGPLGMLAGERAAAGRADEPFEITVSARIADIGDPGAWDAAGVDRLIVAPWDSPRDALAATKAFADRHI